VTSGRQAIEISPVCLHGCSYRVDTDASVAEKVFTKLVHKHRNILVTLSNTAYKGVNFLSAYPLSCEV